ncbi:alpha-galactosidase [Paenibacillus gansuensis]|uniref:Alpha-galactosidase n=1 Tax=Paenibacillus gansuensis TaxID=306542 RepID=A0ABW5PEY8_9BACL
MTMNVKSVWVESNPWFALSVQEGSPTLLTYTNKHSGISHSIYAPVFELDGEACTAILSNLQETGRRILPNRVSEYELTGEFGPKGKWRLHLLLRVPDDNPVLRFKYRLSASGESVMTKALGKDAISYAGVQFPIRTADGEAEVREVRFSEFVEPVHSYCLQEQPLDERHFAAGLDVAGPMIASWGGEGEDAQLLAYEHGSQMPDSFLRFRLAADGLAEIQAAKGNYLTGQPIGRDRYYDTIWFQYAAVSGGEKELTSAYRAFVLHHMALYPESRQPYIFYNTWNNQERDKHFRGKSYLASITEERMLAEIEKAHRIGVDVFVIDTGWYTATGDWEVNPDRFPRGLTPIKERLDSYGMKLGLWFGPNSAALSSRMLQRNQNNLMHWQGVKPDPHPVWETELSEKMCLVSPYADDFADTLIRLARDLGVTYFKWDAVQQYGCDHYGHGHGDSGHTSEERRDHYAFRLGIELTRIVEKMQEACPEAIVDFDITEGGRYVGLGFLSVGKYFLINNGPYYQNYNVPIDEAVDNWNIFFHPGPARSWICRTTYDHDKWIPSILFLTHYFPDDPADFQQISAGSLMLGHNGIWGDLLSVSEEGTDRLGRILGTYKKIRNEITAGSMTRYGKVGGSLEVYEKICGETGKGVIVLFAAVPGKQRYLSASSQLVRKVWHTAEAAVSFTEDGSVIVDVEFDKPGAAIVFFGVDS